MTAKWTFRAEPGVFIELADLEGQYPLGKVVTQPNLGLIPRAYPSDTSNSPDQRDWVRLAVYVKSLNDSSPENVKYKVLYLTRHGLGYHNKKHVEVGTVEWERKWAFEDGDENETWFDAHLTDVGIRQAKDLSKFWTALVADGTPLPSTTYTSPLARCLQTTNYIFRPLLTSHSRPFQPIIKENLRERITLHRCDFRRPKSWIAANYPDYTFEEGFAEEDIFAGKDIPETDAEHEARKQKVLEEVWEGDEGTFLELTVHSYAISAIRAVLGLRPCRAREGTSFAYLVRGERVGGE
ncbi:Fc.00g007070.m01.CDS01 [Cosmosporella sp. VM-42]